MNTATLTREPEQRHSHSDYSYDRVHRKTLFHDMGSLGVGIPGTVALGIRALRR